MKDKTKAIMRQELREVIRAIHTAVVLAFLWSLPVVVACMAFVAAVLNEVVAYYVLMVALFAAIALVAKMCFLPPTGTKAEISWSRQNRCIFGGLLFGTLAFVTGLTGDIEFLLLMFVPGILCLFSALGYALRFTRSRTLKGGEA